MSTGGGGYPRHGRTTRPKADLPFAARSAEHPLPPSELNEEEAEIFRGIVNRMPPDYFAPPTWPLLVNLCRHVRLSRWFARQLQDLEKKLPHALNEERTQVLRDMMALSRAQANESRTIAMLCSRLKLTQLYDSTSLHKARRAFLTDERPWDVPADADEELPQ
jgi:hypothetical protein